MVSLSYIALAASTLMGLASAAPSTLDQRQSIPSNQKFYVRMWVISGDTKYTGWSLETYHTVASNADPVFVNGTGTPAILNGTHLQFDNGSPAPTALNAIPDDETNVRWVPVSFSAGYGETDWVFEGGDGFQVQDGEAGGWIVCEWSHGINAPQLFQLINGFDPDEYDVPSTCAVVVLLPEYI